VADPGVRMALEIAFKAPSLPYQCGINAVSILGFGSAREYAA
jgi:hypothetical protein